MVCVHIVDNLLFPSAEKSVIEPYIAGQIAGLICENTVAANSDDTYSYKALKHLVSNKNEKTIMQRVENGFLVYLTDMASMVVGCGMVVYNHERYFAKTLHVENAYKGMGYARLICSIREKMLAQKGIEELYIESLMFPATIDFHKSRGFVETEPYRDLYYSILMKKNLKEAAL